MAEVPAAAPGSLSVPKEAVEVEPGLFAAKDAKGKTWHYRRTPFGVRKFEPETVKDTSEEDAEFMTATEDGDKIKFERKTPWGKAQWTKKKSELNGAETVAWKRISEGKNTQAAKGIQK